ncbi:MAG: hypothetical protein H0W76_23595 [Pyrinomonadaceae bacterium]|nr:hypothetical protein [Pyrinomonadaceae bacterium]
MFKCSSASISRVVRQTIAGGLILALLSGHSAPASTIKHSPNTGVQGDEFLIPDGTELSVVTTEEISSKTATEGDLVNFKIEDDLVVNNQIVIAKGTLAKGTISAAEKSGRLGKGGKLGIKVESTTTVDNQKIKLRASQGKQGDDKTGTTIALIALFGVFGFLKKGNNAKIKEGTKIKVYTDEAKKVRVKGGII